MVDVIIAEDIPGTNGDEEDKLLAVDEVWMGHAFPDASAHSHLRTPVTQLSLPPSFFYHQDSEVPRPQCPYEPCLAEEITH